MMKKRESRNGERKGKQTDTFKCGQGRRQKMIDDDTTRSNRTVKSNQDPKSASPTRRRRNDDDKTKEARLEVPLDGSLDSGAILLVKPSVFWE